MPIINPDTSNAVNFQPITPGIYKARIVKCEPKTSSKGNPMIEVGLEVTVPPEAKPRERTTRLVITGKGAYGFEQLLRATGFGELADKYSDPNQPNPQFDTDWLINQEMMVSIEPNVYKDNDGVERRGDQIVSYLPK